MFRPAYSVGWQRFATKLLEGLLLAGMFCALGCSASLSAEEYLLFEPNAEGHGELNPYGLDIWEAGFDPSGGTKHNRWGVYLAKEDGVNVVFRNQTTTAISGNLISLGGVPDKFEVNFAEINDALDDLILTESLEHLGRKGEGWRSGTDGVLRGTNLTFSVPNTNTYYLLRKLHFQTDPVVLTNELTGKPLKPEASKLIILIHGWNPDGDKAKDSYQDGSEFGELSQALRTKMKKKSDWALVHYHWETDASAGSNKLLSEGKHVYTNGAEASEVSYMHGIHLGKTLAERMTKVEKIHFIAHSAGTWCARSAALYLSRYAGNSNLEVQITLLDPFVPNKKEKLNSRLGKDKIDALSAGSVEVSEKARGGGGGFMRVPTYRLENYYAVDRFTSDAIYSATSGFFSWAKNDEVKQLRVDFTQKLVVPELTYKNLASGTKVYYPGHGGPIEFYTDSITGKLERPRNSKELGEEYADWGTISIGWNNSFFIEENPELKKFLGGNIANSQTTFQTGETADDLFSVPYNRGSEQTGEPGGQCVVFVQKMRPELAIGWGDAANGPKRAREEGFEVNSLPRVGAVFIDPARRGNPDGHTGIVTSVTKDQVNGRDYYRLLIDDSNAATYEKVRRDVLMWLRIEQDGTVVFDPSAQRDRDAYTLYGLGENNDSGTERAILFIHEKVAEYDQKRAQLADYYHLNNDAQLDQVMALRRNLVFYLVDRSGSMKGQGGSLDLRDEVRDRIFAHAAQQGANTKVELQFFNSNAGSVADWHPFNAGNLNQFKAHFNQQFNPDGGTRLFDTVYEVTEHLRAQGADYNQIQLVIFSDGEDNESSARGQAERWKVISPSLAQLRISNHFVRAYLFTMGYEISAQDATTLKEIGVEVTAVAVEAAQQNLKHLDRVLLKEGTQFNGKLLGKDIQFDKMFGRTRVALKDLIAYENGAIRTKDGVSQEVESAQGSMDMDTGESTISIKMENVSSIIMAE